VPTLGFPAGFPADDPPALPRADAIGTTLEDTGMTGSASDRTRIAPGSQTSAHFPQAVHFSQSTEM
jgi:hypothetical protein